MTLPAPIEAHDGVVWQPRAIDLQSSNLAALMRLLRVADYDELLELSTRQLDRFWGVSLKHLGIEFEKAPDAFLDLSRGKAWPRFFPGGQFNFARACLQAPLGGAGGNTPALIWENEAGERVTLNYAELGARTAAFAQGLQRLGVVTGDRVGLLMPNVPEAVIAFLAIAWMGAISVPLFSGFGAEPAVQRLRDAGARCLVSADGFVRRGKPVRLGETVQAIRQQMPELGTVVLADVLREPPQGFDFHRWSEVERRNERGTCTPEATATDSPFMVMYTSGTTGKPKGAVHVHAGFPLRVAQDAAYLFDFKAGDRLMWVSDMGWMVGPLSIIASLMLKGTLVLYDGAPDQPDVGRLRSMAARYGVTHFGSAPTAIRGMAAAPHVALASSFPTLRILITAGEVIDPDTFDWYFRSFGGGDTPVINYTGGTEVSAAILTNVVLRPIAPCCFNSIAPGMAAGVIGAEGQRLLGKPGELAIFEPFVGMTSGFWGDPDRYLESYWSSVPDTWVHGDLAIEHKDGQLQLLGRSDDVMKIAGKRVGPSELEGAVIDGKAIVDAFAIGVPDSTSGESLVLFVVPGPAVESSVSVQRLASAALERSMGRPYRPTAVVSVTRLPKTRNGKAVRRLARQAWLGQPAGNVAGLEDSSIYGELVLACAAARSRPAED